MLHWGKVKGNNKHYTISDESKIENGSNGSGLELNHKRKRSLTATSGSDNLKQKNYYL